MEPTYPLLPLQSDIISRAHRNSMKISNKKKLMDIRTTSVFRQEKNHFFGALLLLPEMTESSRKSVNLENIDFRICSWAMRIESAVGTTVDE
ncbi:hypothetical protein CEXT_367871 [Caerostris extrusa]|uniref:Uncharacterized protein n=1 Tax=Caerostris extrusa TaxID=172846 RepID=A0AAV4N872_CAEEX|nr:hypothetical protein CEXT_367871 [Caerostris extrusa]